jgi:hypothetical protein
MSAKKETTSPEKAARSQPKEFKNPDQRLWRTHREDSVFFQREAQVNFWTVLGGLAMAALLTQLGPLLVELGKSRWHLVLFMLTSILVIATSWVQTSWGSLVMKWPISIISTVLNIFGMLAQSIQCLLITNPAGWMAATSAILFFALALQWYFRLSGAWSVFTDGMIARIKIINLVYLFLVFLCLGGALQLYLFPSHLAEIIWGFVVFIFAILALIMQHKSMQVEKKELGIP